MKQRIAVVSDIHGNLPALEAVWAAIELAGVDAVVNLGDIVSGPLWPLETARWLMARPDWWTIAGNHERQVLTLPPERMGASDRHAAQRLGEPERAWLAGLPATLWLSPRVYCCHGRPDDDLRYLMESLGGDLGQAGSSGIRPASSAELDERLGAVQAELILCGHSHVPRLMMASRHRLVVNPGSVGLQAFDDSHGKSHCVENGHPLARWALAARGSAGWQVALQATPYDWEAAARQAETNGRGDWADALRTGRVGRTESDLV